MRLLFLSLVLAFGVANSAAAQSTSVPLTSFLHDKAGDSALTYSAFKQSVAALSALFDEVCGDSFCEGEFSHIVSINFECLISDAAVVSQCQWHFLAYEDLADPESGDLRRREQTFHCAIPFGGSLMEFASFLRTFMPPSTTLRSAFFQHAIPGASPGQTMYASLSQCLNG